MACVKEDLETMGVRKWRRKVENWKGQNPHRVIELEEDKIKEGSDFFYIFMVNRILGFAELKNYI